MARKKIPAVAYLRTSSATNASNSGDKDSDKQQRAAVAGFAKTSVGKGLSADKDSDKRQRAAITGFAKSNGYEVVAEFYDVVSGADPIGERPGFKAMLDRIAGNGVKVIIVESPDRFARDLAVQLAGHDYLRSLGVELIPASAPDFFTEDTPTAVLVRQVLGAISQFEKASLVAKLRAARERKKAAGGRGSGRFTYALKVPATVALAGELNRQRMSLREISAALAERGHLTGGGRPYSANAVQAMLRHK